MYEAMEVKLPNSCHKFSALQEKIMIEMFQKHTWTNCGYARQKKGTFTF